MLDRQHNQIVFECDECGETLETGESDFSDALSAFRDDGWRSRLVEGSWVHLCGDCLGGGA